MLKSSFCLFVVPSGRWGHDMCLTDKNKAVLIGGQGRKLQMAKDSVWTLEFANGELMMLTSLGNNSSWYTSVQIKDTVQRYFILSLQLPGLDFCLDQILASASTISLPWLPRKSEKIDDESVYHVE